MTTKTKDIGLIGLCRINFEIINERQISYNQAKEEICNYCKENETTYLSEIANDLELPLLQVNEILLELMSEGTIEEVD